jgi:hypothetical protein
MPEEFEAPDFPMPPRCERCGYEGLMWWHFEFNYRGGWQPSAFTESGSMGDWEWVMRILGGCGLKYELIYGGEVLKIG